MTDLIDRVITVRASHGVEFNVRLLLQGDRYGLDDCLVWTDRPGVEFYDRRYPHTRYGQFVTRYYVDTLMQTPKTNGLDLDGGVHDWYIDASSYVRNVEHYITRGTLTTIESLGMILTTMTTTTSVLNTYAGDNIWQDIILRLDDYDDAATDAIDIGRSDRFVAGGIEYRHDGNEWAAS